MYLHIVCEKYEEDVQYSGTCKRELTSPPRPFAARRVSGGVDPGPAVIIPDNVVDSRNRRCWPGSLLAESCLWGSDSEII